MIELTALLVDDDTVSHFINVKVLNQIGSKIHTVLNGREALYLLSNNETALVPDIIFVDINMPVMDGFEFIRA